MKFIFILFSLFILKVGQAQEVVASSGKNLILENIQYSLAQADSMFEATTTVMSIEEYASLSQKTSSLKKTGIILMATGGVITAVGTAIGISEGGFSYSYNNTNGYVSESGTPLAGLAGVMLCCGVPTLLGGVVCTIIGIKKGK
jgi:hypothetical protein